MLQPLNCNIFSIMQGATNAAGSRNATSTLSSPIYVPSTASATPTPAGGMSLMQNAPLTFGAQVNYSADSYEEFWAHFGTPVITDTNLPSALQSPPVLAPLINTMQYVPAWPTSTPRSDQTSTLNTQNLENFPPLPSTLESHPPVADRLRRKRRRGLSPVSGERAKKAARRKGKGKANARTTIAADGAAVAPALTNPWASDTGRHTDERRQTSAAISPFSLPPSSLPSSHQTPYTDFTRSGSASTSFYGRLNNSGSYPTPHRTSDISTTPRANLSTNLSQQSQLPAAVTSSNRQPGRSGALSEAPSSRTGDWSANVPPELEAPVESLLNLSSMRDVSMDEVSRRSEASNGDARRRLWGILSNSRSMDNGSRASRRSTVEDAEEEGELSGLPYETSFATRSYVRHSSSRFEPYPQGSNAPLPTGLSIGRERGEDSQWSERRGWRNEPLRSIPGHADGQARDERDNYAYRYTDRDESTGRRAPLDFPYIPPDPSMPRQPRLQPHANQGAPPISPPSNRLHSLDVFDIGDDDNLPEAVRRGGAATEGEDERPTPISREGDPEVHRQDPEAHLRGLSDDWIQEVWSDPAGTSITLSMFNPHFTRSYGANRRAASDLRRSITQITGETNFLVIAPDQAADFRGRGPVEWAVTGLSREGVDRILRRRVWSFRYITFFPRRRALNIPRWLLAVEGFLDDNTANIERAIRSTFERPQVRQRIEQMIRANPEFLGIPTNEAFRRIMSSLRVTVYTLDNETVVANIFLRSPTQSVKVWRRWIMELRDLTFGSFHTAIARVRRVSTCAGCLGVDHPTHLCPFPRMQGWNGPESAGGLSYSVDGRERRGRETTTTIPPSTDPHSQRRQRNQPRYGTDNAQAGPSRARGSQGMRDWEDAGYDHGRENGRGRGRERDQERPWDRNGTQRRGRKDNSRPPRGGRDAFNRDSRR